jgi:hypothetical protein
MTRLGPPAVVLIRPAPAFTGRKASAVVPGPPPGNGNGFEDDPSQRRSAFAGRFRDDPVSAVNGMTRDVLLRRMDAEEAAGLLLPYLVRASYGQRNLVFNALMEFARPQDLVFASLAVYERDRDPRVLETAAELLQHYGEEAGPLLVRLARSGRRECRYFVGTILHMEPEGCRREAILALAEHPDPRTRRELLDEADRTDPEDAAFVCRALAGDPEADIRESARENLAFLEP